MGISTFCHVFYEVGREKEVQSRLPVMIKKEKIMSEWLQEIMTNVKLIYKIKHFDTWPL